MLKYKMVDLISTTAGMDWMSVRVSFPHTTATILFFNRVPNDCVTLVLYANSLCDLFLSNGVLKLLIPWNCYVTRDCELDIPNQDTDVSYYLQLTFSICVVLPEKTKQPYTQTSRSIGRKLAYVLPFLAFVGIRFAQRRSMAVTFKLPVYCVTR